MDSLFFGICFHLSGHFWILKDSFDGDKKKFINTHQNLIEFARRLNIQFRALVFAKFLYGATIICVLGFQVLMTDGFVMRFIASNYIVAIFVQLLFYALGGQLIMSSSGAIADSIITVDKDCLLIIARAQKPSSIHAWFYNADLATYQTILASAASFFTVLKSVSD